MNFLSDLRSQHPPATPVGCGLPQTLNLKAIGTAVALAVAVLSYARAQEFSNSVSETTSTAEMQAKAAAALNAIDGANTSASNVMVPAATTNSTLETPSTAEKQAKAAASLNPDVANTGTAKVIALAATPIQAVASKDTSMNAGEGSAHAVVATNPGESSSNVGGDSTNADEILTNGMEVLDNNYKLAVGDSITFQITEDENDPQAILVQDSGDVVIPYIGRYPANGKTCKELAWELKKELEKKYYYRATVIISVNMMITHGVVYVFGAVKAPGPLEMPRDDMLTISTAILRAGGFDDFADTKHVRVTRRTDSGTNEDFIVNVSDVLDKGQSQEDMPAKPGDRIYVKESNIRF